MRKLACGLAGVAAVLAAAPAVAHHAFAMFDQSKLVYITGTVKEFELVNPHGWLHVAMPTDKADTAKGDTAIWAFEGGSVNQLTSLGWKDSVRPGDKVEVGFYRMKDGSRGGQLMNVKLPDGRKLCSNRGCGDGTGSVLAPF